MTSGAHNVKEYITTLPLERREAVIHLREIIVSNLPPGFQETMAYGMPAYVVPHALYPPGYHCDTKLPLPFLSFASQKNFIALYHMGLYASPQLLKWFTSEYSKYSSGKLDMGKSCIRFKKPELIPFTLIAQLVAKMSADEWIHLYESNLTRK